MLLLLGDEFNFTEGKRFIESILTRLDPSKYLLIASIASKPLIIGILISSRMISK
jgi:hypothetical protein